MRYSTHAEAALAIQLGNARILFGKPIKVLAVYVLSMIRHLLHIVYVCSLKVWRLAVDSVHCTLLWQQPNVSNELRASSLLYV